MVVFAVHSFSGLLRGRASGRSSAWLERLVWDQEVEGSNPFAPIRFEDGKQGISGFEPGMPAVGENSRRYPGAISGRCDRAGFLHTASPIARHAVDPIIRGSDSASRGWVSPGGQLRTANCPKNAGFQMWDPPGFPPSICRSIVQCTSHIATHPLLRVSVTVSGNPLIDAGPKEVLLARPPLVRVIAQVRFPEILSVEKRDFVARFQEAIRADYPVLREEKTQSIFFPRTAVGQAAPAPHTAWRFCDQDDSWRVSLASGFVALETDSYTSQADFMNRLAVVLRAAKDTLAPARVDRLGLRYIDRITGQDFELIQTLVRPEVLGVIATNASNNVVHTLAETLLKSDNPSCFVLMRTGVLPPNAVVDLTAIEPVPQMSWILDLDVFGDQAAEFDADWVVKQVDQYASRIYAIFRWVVTDQFLEHFGERE